MMSYIGDEKRQNWRHEYQQKVYFDFIYDYKAKVDFNSSDEYSKEMGFKYHGVSQNISTKGLCFRGDKELNRGEEIVVQVHVPEKERIVFLEGEVRWSKLALVDDEGNQYFDTGIQLSKIQDKDVLNTVRYDEEYKVFWSDVLEECLGSFRH